MIDNYNLIELLTDYRDIDLIVNDVINELSNRIQIDNVNGVKIA